MRRSHRRDVGERESRPSRACTLRQPQEVSILIRRRVALAALCLALLSSINGLPRLTSSALAATPQAAATATPQLEALSGEYTDPVEPDTPMSFYVLDGKLLVESERLIPTELTSNSATEFIFPKTKGKLTFTLDAGGRGASVIASEDPGAVYRRTGDPIHHVFHDYQRTEVMIPMRDGVKLHAVILKPADIATALPFLIQRTPYGVDGTNRASFFDGRPELARAGYIYVAEDIRGRFKSEGQFVMSRPMADHKAPKAIDESTDAYDT